MEAKGGRSSPVLSREGRFPAPDGILPMGGKGTPVLRGKSESHFGPCWGGTSPGKREGLGIKILKGRRGFLLVAGKETLNL